MEKVCVTCRGNSLKSINKVPPVDAFVVVNDFSSGEVKIPGLSDALGDTPITHMFNWNTFVNEVPLMLSQQFYTKYNVTAIVSPYTVEAGYKPFEVVGRNGVLPFRHFPDELKPYMTCHEDPTAKYKWDYPSSGNGAILYGALIATKELHIIGLDFFQQGVHGYASGAPIAPGNNGDEMREFLIEQTFKMFPDIKFYIYTCANINNVPSNVTVIKVDQFYNQLDI